jgi:hypothetical protein
MIMPEPEPFIVGRQTEVEQFAALVHRGGNKHQVFDAENMSGCYQKPVEDFRKRVLVGGRGKH